MTTNKEALKNLQDLHDAPKLLLEWRKAAKVLSTYLNIDGKYFNGDRLCPQYNLSATATGRLSGGGEDGVNFQNMPKGAFRKLFIPDEGDEMVVVGDWSQIEYRLTALLAGDKDLLEHFNDPTFDIHQRTADGLGVDRTTAKRINHATNYGMQAKKMAASLRISVKKAREFIENMKLVYPILQRYREAVVRTASKRGWLANPFGRRGYFQVDSKGKVEPAKVVAFTPQSTAADMMIRIIGNAYDAGLKLRWTVHDELGISSNDPLRDAEILREIMEAPFPELNGFSCPVDIGIGVNWYEAKQ